MVASRRVLIISIVGHLIKGWDIEEALLSGLLLGQLLLMRKVFTAQSDRPSVIQGIRVLIGSLLFTLAYGTAGFFLLDRHYSQIFTFGGAIRQTLALFFTANNAGIQPTNELGKFFIDSVYIIGAFTLLYALWMLFRPVLFRGAASAAEREKAREIVAQYGQSSLAHFTLLPDKSYYFSPSGNTVIAYAPMGSPRAIPLAQTMIEQKQLWGFSNFVSAMIGSPLFTKPSAIALISIKISAFKPSKLAKKV